MTRNIRKNKFAYNLLRKKNICLWVGGFPDADRRRLYNFGGFVSTFLDWDEKKEEVKDQVLRHGLSAVLVDIKGKSFTGLKYEKL